MVFSSNTSREVGTPFIIPLISLVKICSSVLFGLPYGMHAKAVQIQL